MKLANSLRSKRKGRRSTPPVPTAVTTTPAVAPDANEHEPHANLMRLEALKPTLTYPGWKRDYKEEEKMHRRFKPYVFEKCLFRLEERQRMHDGDRSHERLERLDSQRWSYPGWQDDFRQAEKYHVWNRRDAEHLFEELYKEMRLKQRQHCSLNQEQEAATIRQLGLTCTICLEAPRSHVFIPCGHFVACESCALKAFQWRSACPICRKKSSMVTKVFFS